MARRVTSASTSKPRRSERLNKASTGTQEFLQSNRRSKKPSASRRRKRDCMLRNDRIVIIKRSTATPIRTVKAELRTVEELSERERLLQIEEREYKKRKQILDIRELELEQTMRMREVQLILQHLEEHYQCSLCFEIVACPYVLSPAECGHTFCAICTIKWFFSRLHRGCGTWHESVACPLCRSLLIITPDITPRPTITIPFAPNRVAEKSLKAMVDRLEILCSPVAKCKRSPSVSTRTICKAIDDDEEDEIPIVVVKVEDASPVAQMGESGMEAWAEGGTLRSDWIERDRTGRFEMDDLIARWKELQGHDFVEIKDRLGL